MIVDLLLLVRGQISVDQVDVRPLRIRVPSKRPLAHEHQLGVIWNLLVEECLTRHQTQVSEDAHGVNYLSLVVLRHLRAFDGLEQSHDN